MSPSEATPPLKMCLLLITPPPQHLPLTCRKFRFRCCLQISIDLISKGCVEYHRYHRMMGEKTPPIAPHRSCGVG